MAACIYWTRVSWNYGNNCDDALDLLEGIRRCHIEAEIFCKGRLCKVHHKLEIHFKFHLQR